MELPKSGQPKHRHTSAAVVAVDLPRAASKSFISFPAVEPIIASQYAIPLFVLRRGYAVLRKGTILFARCFLFNTTYLLHERKSYTLPQPKKVLSSFNNSLHAVS